MSERDRRRLLRDGVLRRIRVRKVVRSSAALHRGVAFFGCDDRQF